MLFKLWTWKMHHLFWIRFIVHGWSHWTRYFCLWRHSRQSAESGWSVICRRLSTVHHRMTRFRFLHSGTRSSARQLEARDIYSTPSAATRPTAVIPTTPKYWTIVFGSLPNILVYNAQSIVNRLNIALHLYCTQTLHLIRSTDVHVLRRTLSFTHELSFLFFRQYTKLSALSIRACRWPSNVFRRFDRKYSFNNCSIDLAHTSTNFHRGSKVRNLASFLTSLNFEPPAFENAAKYPNSETNFSCSHDHPMSSPNLVKLGPRTPRTVCLSYPTP